ncbi:cobalamin B12-binding domain-containing protein [Plantactinospora sp. WMMB782]|uniref:cobalamin B12-binding domain-containing protein n=1 Tax=Plantactinospora sp. WMMB782 TaxID=3404121 RepID=UPI003B932E15
MVTGLASDSHTWNLVYLQLLIEELGYDVVNLGPCVPDDLLVAECQRLEPAMIVMSSVNGHGQCDGLRVIRLLRRCARLATTPIVIGGKLGLSADRPEVYTDRLMAAGFDAVFVDGSIAEFRKFLATADAMSSIEAER